MYSGQHLNSGELAGEAIVDGIIWDNKLIVFITKVFFFGGSFLWVMIRRIQL